MAPLNVQGILKKENPLVSRLNEMCTWGTNYLESIDISTPCKSSK